MEQASYTTIRGHLILVGKDPDGDSIRFKPDNPMLLQRLDQANRLRISADGTVQLRLEGIDAPETHYQGAAQPLGSEARRAFLESLGFKTVTPFDRGVITSASPTTLKAAILTKMVDANGRPIAYVYTNDFTQLRSGSIASPSPNLVSRSHNIQLLTTGRAYPIIYSSMPTPHRHLFQDEATRARKAKLGVWKQDASAHFELIDQASLGPTGQLIMPKLFRRCTDYLRAHAGGFQGGLADWMRSTQTAASPGENDLLWTHGQKTHLSDQITQQGTTISYNADLITTIFQEK